MARRVPIGLRADRPVDLPAPEGVAPVQARSRATSPDGYLTPSLHEIAVTAHHLLGPLGGHARHHAVTIEQRHQLHREALELVGPAQLVQLGPLAEQQRSEEHTSELQSLTNIVCRLTLGK